MQCLTMKRPGIRTHLKITSEKAWADKHPMTIEEAFWSRVDQSAGDKGCWPYTGFRLDGYGMFIYRQQSRRAHRFAYEVIYGPVSNQKYICHTCDNRACCNPLHLWLGTHAENQRDKLNKGRQSRGEKNHSKLTEEQVIELRRIHSDGLGYRRLAKQYGCHVQTIRNIIQRKKWRHVPDASSYQEPI